MEVLHLDLSYFPEKEDLQYSLKMMGAKGAVNVKTASSSNTVDLKCQVLGSLLFPSKKIVDSEISTRLEINIKTQELELLRHIDNDFKSESRRQMEIKDHGIETRYIKFDEERGYIDIPDQVKTSAVADPLSISFLARDKRLLHSENEFVVNLLVRSGILKIQLKSVETRNARVEALDSNREQTRIRIESLSEGQIKGPYLSPDLEVWLDQELGIITEVTYPFLGNLGRATLLLEKYNYV